MNVTINGTYPSAYITSPSQGQAVNEGATIDIVGTANDADFDFYILQYAPGVSPSTGFVDITPAQVTTPVLNGPLGSWDTTGLDEGLYTVRLFVMDLAGHFVRFDMQVDVLSRLSLADVPDVALEEDESISDFVHLPDYCSALSGDVESFTYSIVGNTEPDCGVGLDADDNIDVWPTPRRTSAKRPPSRARRNLRKCGWARP